MLKLESLIDVLQEINNKYGNLDVDVNVLGGEHYFIQSICVDTTTSDYKEDDKLPSLYIEIDTEENKDRILTIYKN
jgi:hypothetical protein